MENVRSEASAAEEIIKQFGKIHIIENYYLVLGGGKIGTDFLEYARKNKFPFVLVIDKDENALAARGSDRIKTEDELVNLLNNKASASLHAEDFESSSAAGENGRRKNEMKDRSSREENNEQVINEQVITKENNEQKIIEEKNESEVYFYKMSLDNIPFLLSLGIPEYIIPAVPCHAVAYMLPYILKFHLEPEKRENPEKIQSECHINRPATELFIRPEDEKFMTFFEKFAASFPEDLIAGNYPEYGMLFFSYAKEGEICPDGCPGPKDRCPTFGRKKPETITEYTKKLLLDLPGWVFESHQMKPGIGGLKGEEFKQNLLEILEFLSTFRENRGRERSENLEDRTFFIATTCTCHGVLNLFYVT